MQMNWPISVQNRRHFTWHDLSFTEQQLIEDSAGPMQVNGEKNNPLSPLGFFDIHPKSSEVR